MACAATAQQHAQNNAKSPSHSKVNQPKEFTSRSCQMLAPFLGLYAGLPSV